MLNMLNTEPIGASAPNETVIYNGSVIRPENSSRARILVADDHFLIAETISMLLAPHFDVVGVVTDAKVVAEEVARLRPEVVLLDVTMPGLNGIAAARMILEQAPNTRIVFLTMHANRVIVREAFQAGASAFVVKNCAASDLVLAVKTVLEGGSYISSEVHEGWRRARPEDLSERQVSVLRLIAQGSSAKQIGYQLTISSRTAEFHKNAIMDKLKLRSTAELTRYALELGIAS
jgi:DNA-binding NarL/FixJ family response regulator